MKGEAQPLIKYFDGSDKRFIIPLYQRNYDWKEDNCKQLFQDLMKLHTSGRKSHFFGSIVSSIVQGSEDRFIIDGQQRITTVSLLLIAMVKAYREGLITAVDTKLHEKIFKRYLVDEYQEDERKVKLKPIKKDMEAFDALLFLPKEQYIKSSNVTRNYDYFYDEVQKCGLTLDDLFNTIKGLEVINIKLEEGDDPQLIFESLNSTGLDLTEADKIRNYLLMSLSPQEQDDLYTRFWNPIEEKTKYDTSPFVRDYLTMKQGKIGRIDKIYFIFKEYAEKENLSRTELMEEMYHYANIYHQIDTATTSSSKVNTCLKRIQTLESTVAYPFYMAFFDYAQANGISDDIVCHVLDLVENYWARRIICNLPSNALNKVFATLHRDVLRTIAKSTVDGVAPKYDDVLTYILLKKDQSSIFPRDEKFKASFAERQVYKMPRAIRTFILERLENRDNNEQHDIVKLLTEDQITIEHIMPQTLSDKWKAALGDDWERIHEQYLHTMANLTLTGYNSQYSNLPFVEKRDMEKGFNDSAFRLNNDVKTCDKWTEDELIQRQGTLFNVALKLWPMPSTSFRPVEKELETASLDDEDFEFTGKKLQAYSYRGIRYPVSTWKDMLINVCMLVLLEHRATFEWMSANEKCHIAKENADWRTEITDNFYVWTANSTITKIGILRSIFDECGVSGSELVFEFRSESEETEE